MKNFEQKRKTVRVLQSIKCDSCDKVYEANDIMEIQEFLHISFNGGYGSRTVGDMHSAEADICQYCTVKLLGSVLRISDGFEEWKLPQRLIDRYS